MTSKVIEQIKHCKSYKRDTLHYRNTKEVSWVMHLVLTIFTIGLWGIVLFIVLIFHILTKPIAGDYTCSICGSKS